MFELVLANIAEPFGSILSSNSSHANRLRDIQCEHDLATRALFWGRKSAIIVLPQLPPTELRTHVRSLTTHRLAKVMAPRNCAISLCDAIGDDKELFESLLRSMKRHPPVRVSAYATTPELYRLLELFKSRGVIFDTHTVRASQSWWLARHLDSKVGFRAEMGRLGDISRSVAIPNGFVCADGPDAINAVEWFLRRDRGCVVKANFGQSGWGLAFVKANGIRGDARLRAPKRSLMAKFRGDPIWRSSLLVVEEHIRVQDDPRVSTPCVELHVGNAGPRVTSSSAQLVGRRGEFRGIVIGPGYPPADCKRKIESFGLAVGRHFHSLGIRGYFDIDFVVSTAGGVYAVESNVRRSAVTHVADLKRRLGSKFKAHYFQSDEAYVYGKQTLPPKEVFGRLAPLLLRCSGKDGIVVTSVSKTAPVIGYVLIADRYERILELQEALVTTFRV
jgi:hypothetical protein